MYGTTGGGGDSVYGGTVFRYDLSTSTLTTLHHFDGTDGSHPNTGLVQADDGALYGVTAGGGASDRGTIFRVDPSTGVLTTLYDFDSTSGRQPDSTLRQGTDGALYGTTSFGGAFDYGTLFRFDLSNLQPSTLVNVTGLMSHPSGLLQGADGAFYGVTPRGGSNGKGMVFRYAAGSSTLTSLHSFNGTDGAFPTAALLQGADGAFYSTASEGGRVGHGGCSGWSCGVTSTATGWAMRGTTVRRCRTPDRKTKMETGRATSATGPP